MFSIFKFVFDSLDNVVLGSLRFGIKNNRRSHELLDRRIWFPEHGDILDSDDLTLGKYRMCLHDFYNFVCTFEMTDSISIGWT